MATRKVYKVLTTSWQRIEGAAANTPSCMWQNGSQVEVQLSFGATAPAGEAADAYVCLGPKDFYVDVNGSAAVWGRSVVDGGIAMCTAD